MTGREIRELLDAAADRFPQFAERIHFDPGRTVNDSSTNWVDGRVDFNNRRGKSRLLVSGMKAPSI